MHSATDQQSKEIGGVTADAAWELCCRVLTRPENTAYLTSRDLAQLLVYWIDESPLPRQMQETAYADMKQDLDDRGKTCQTEQDEDSMKSRWLRLKIQNELEAVREALAASGKELPLELEVEAAMTEVVDAPSLSADAEKEAATILATLKAAKADASRSSWDDPGPMRIRMMGLGAMIGMIMIMMGLGTRRGMATTIAARATSARRKLQTCWRVLVPLPPVPQLPRW